MNELAAHHEIESRGQAESVLAENFDAECLGLGVVELGADLRIGQGIVHRAVGFSPAEEAAQHEAVARTEQRSVVGETPAGTGVLLTIAVEPARQIAVIDQKTARADY